MAAAARVLLDAKRARVPDGADLRDIAVERQAHRPVDDRPDLARGARDLAHVVGARHPPSREPGEREPPQPGDRLVATQIDERAPVAVPERHRLADAELGGDVAGEGSGTAAQSPIAHTPSMPSTRMYRSTTTRA